MWTSIFVASTKEQADKICERLEAEGRGSEKREFRDTRARIRGRGGT